MTSVARTVELMCEYSLGIEHWWFCFIKEQDRESAANAIKDWLHKFPNRIVMGIEGIGSHKPKRHLFYVLPTLKIPKDKRLELYNFFNNPITITKHYAYGIINVERSE